MEPTSEQELKQLLDEGKITEEEYRQLLAVIHLKDKPQAAPETSEQANTRTGFGKAALILMVSGFLLPLIPMIINIILTSNAARGVNARIIAISFFPFLLLGFLCLLLAFVFGIIGWKTTSGKIAALGVPAVGIFAFLVSFLVLPVMFVRLQKTKAEAAHQYMESYKAYPLDSLEGVLTQEGVAFDEQVSSDGKGSLRIQKNSPDKTVIRLFETGPMGIDNTMLIYSANLKTERLNGKAYLEMWCDIRGKGEFFSRGIDHPVMESLAWTTVQTPFRLDSGQMPANVKLNLVIEGQGTVWIDDIKLLLNPLN